MKSPMQEFVGLTLKTQYKCTIELQTNWCLGESKWGETLQELREALD